MDYTNVLNRADELLERRGIKGHRAADRFVQDFKAYLVYFDAIGAGFAQEVVGLLEDDSNLTDSAILNTNFRCSLEDLIAPNLKSNKMFVTMFNILLDNNG